MKINLKTNKPLKNQQQFMTSLILTKTGSKTMKIKQQL